MWREDFCVAERKALPFLERKGLAEMEKICLQRIPGAGQLFIMTSIL